jgi:hypothetical protein
MIRTTLAALVVASMGIIGIVSALNPLDDDDWDTDPDKDGLNNREEFTVGSDPNNWDSDGDGLPDGWEVGNALDPTDPTDAEQDNDYYGGEEYAQYTLVDPPYTNYDEYYRAYGIDPETGEYLYAPTNPNDEDTDGDGILDPDDSYPWDYSTIPGDPKVGPPGPVDSCKPCPPIEYIDSDGDGILDWNEAFIGTDPFNPDTDGDGLSDPQEIVRHLDPNDWDSDNDMLIDGVEEGGEGSSDGHIDDTDNDGI